MKALELQAYLESLRGDWEYPEKSYDMYVAGDPETEIQGIAVAWMCYKQTLVHAVELGCNVFVTHEPTYYNHYDDDPAIFRFEGVSDKRRFIEEHELVIIRCHDLWDQMREIGIPDSWGRLLGFGKPIDGNEHIRVYDVGGRSTLEVAQQVAERTKAYGQEAVQLIGPVDKVVHRVCTGTGAITPFQTYLEQFDADMAICTDDGLWYWRDGAFAIDFEIPLVVVNHPVSEDVGMTSLANHLKARFSNLPVHNFPQNCMYRLVPAPT